MTPRPAVSPELLSALKRLRLGRIADTLPERLLLAEKQEMPFEDMLLSPAVRRGLPAGIQRHRRPCQGRRPGPLDAPRALGQDRQGHLRPQAAQ
jgi:hypothetical protein